jgi:hypothetical protein
MWHQELNPDRRQFKCFINIDARIVVVKKSSVSIDVLGCAGSFLQSTYCARNVIIYF